MPRLVNLGVPFGTVAWPDDATDEQIAADYETLRQQAIRKQRLENVRLADIVEQEKPTLEKTLLRTGLGIREGAIGSTEQAVGNVARSYAQTVAPEEAHKPFSLRGLIQTALTPTLLGGYLRLTQKPGDGQSPSNIVQEAGRSLAQHGTDRLREAAYEGEQLGGGLPGQIAQSVGTTAGASAPALLAAPIGLPAAALAGGAQSFGGTLSSFKDRLMELNPKLSEQEAYKQAEGPAAIAGAVTAVLTRTFGGVERAIERFATEGLKKEGIKGVLREAFKSATLEMPEEGLDELAQGFLEKGYVDESKDVGEIINNAALAGATGFALGGATVGGIAAPIKAAEAVGGVVEQGRLRRQSRQESQERIKRVIAEREAQDAAQAKVDEGGRFIDMANVPQADAAERERLRAQGINVLEPGQEGAPSATQVGTETGQPAAPGQETPVAQGTEEPLQIRGATPDGVGAQAVKTAADQAAPEPKGEAQFGGYQFNDPNQPSFKIPGIRGLMRDVSAETAKAAGYVVPATIPTFDEWVAAGRQTGPPPSLEGPGKVSFEAAQLPPPEAVAPWLGGRTPGEYADQVRSASYEEALQGWKETGGLTGTAWQLGLAVRDRADLERLRQAQYEAEQGSVAARAAKDIDALQNSVFKAQFFREAVEAATDSGASKGKWQEKNPGAVAPFAEVRVASPAETQFVEERLQAISAKLDALQKGRTEFAIPIEGRLGLDVSPQATAQIDWQAFSGPDPGGRILVSPEALAEQILNREVDAGAASNAILLHLLKADPRHPLKEIFLNTTDTPVQRRLHGEYTIGSWTREGTVEVLTRGWKGGPISQAEFVKTLNHELLHNIQEKYDQADPILKKDIDDLYAFIVERAKGTEFEKHNATASVAEFLVEALSNPKFQQWMLGLDYSQHIRRVVIGGRSIPAIRENSWLKSAFGGFLGIVKRLFNFPDTITGPNGEQIEVITALHQAVNVMAHLEEIQRMSMLEQFEAIAQRNAAPAPPQEQVRRAADPVSPLESTQIAGTVAEVGRIAEEIYREREEGPQALEALEYERKQYKAAKNELNRLAGLASGRFITDGISAEMIDGGYPDPSEGVGIEDGQIMVEDTFSNKLNAAGVEHNTDTIRTHQAEIYFEGAAHRLNNLLAKIQNLIGAVQYFQADPKEVAKIQKSIAKLEAQAAQLESAVYDGRSVGDRASEIRAIKEEKPFRLAQRDALSLEPVADFFGKNVGGYREFLVKAQSALTTAKALLNKNLDPAQAQALNEEVDRWLNLPDDVRRAIKAGKPLTDEQRASAFAALAETFDDFDLSRNRMLETRDSRTPEIDSELEALWRSLAEAKVDSGTAEVMIADVIAALSGEIGGTGTIQSQAAAQALRTRLTAILNFAENIGRDLETNGALFEWLANPTSQQTFMIANAEAYGVDPATLDMIMHEVKRNPAFSSAVLTLVEAANKKLASLPIVQLEEILQLRGADRMEEAAFLANQLQEQAEARAGIANAAIRENLRKIRALEVERMALDQGVKMFDELGASEEFSSIRNEVANSPYGLVEPMVEQNNTATTFKPFGNKSIPAHEGLVMGASDNIVLKSEWFEKAAKWHKAAQEHIDAYEAVAAAHFADPQNNPSPQVLGFDTAKVRGLKDAAARFVPGSFLELSLLSENKRWKVPWLARKLSKLSWFRQHDFAAKMVGGATGTDLRGRLSDFVNHFLEARTIIQKYRDIPDLLHKAMKTHPEFRMNMANYRDMWNEMAHHGRQFPSPVRAGFVLPLSGITVTAEDVALLKKQQAFEEELRRRVTETTPVAGIRLRRGGRDLVRAGAYVGEDGLPRHLNRQADTFIADVLAAYGETPGNFTPATDLSASSTDPIVAFWNRNGKLLAQHILDSKRQDRSMTLGGLMQQAENSVANDWLLNGAQAITSLDDLVNVIASQNHFPPAPGMNIREHVIKELNKELRQYRDHAARIRQERDERAQARHSKVSIAFSADNEFTRPAAKLELPSDFYDYGALTPGEHLTITSRANHERVVAYATAVQRAIAELQSRFTRFQEETKGKTPADVEALEKKYFTSYGGDRFEAQDVLGILRRIAEDFDAAYALGNPALTQSQWYREGFGTLTSAVLALPTVGLRNMTQGQFQVYTMSRAMGLAGQGILMWRALKNMPRTLARMGLTVGLKAMKGSDLFASMVTGKNVKVFEKLVDELAKLIGQSDYRASGDRVNQLGFDTRDGFVERMARIWQGTEETVAPEDISKAQVNIFGAERKLSQLIGFPVKALRATFDSIGVQQYDQVINGSLLTYANGLRNRLEEVAQNYGQAREALGVTEFDPLDPRMPLKADEWAAFKSQQSNEDSLGLFRLFLESSANPEGFQLEKGLWDFYQAKKTNQAAQMFTPRQFDAVSRRLLAEFNASTPANRASAAAGNRVWQNLLTLQGYASDGTLKLLNAFGGARDRKAQATVWAVAPILASLALVSIIIGYFHSSLTGEWEKRMRGRLTSLPNPLDADFWSSWKRWGDGTIRLGLAQLMYVGDIALMFRGEIQGNRGFDPVGRVFPISIAQRIYRTAVGSWNTYKGSGDFSDALVPMADFGRSLVPYWLEAENAFGLSQGATKQAERLARGEGQIQGLLPETRGFQGPLYGPTTIVRRNLGEAVSALYEAKEKGDIEGAAAATEKAKVEMKKLEDYYAAKYVEKGDDELTAREKAGRDVWNDYQEINPVVAGLLGKRPTAAQFELIQSGLTGARGATFQRGIKAWQSGAMDLFGREGVVTREDVGAARAAVARPRLTPIPGMPRQRSISSRAGSVRRQRITPLPQVGYLRPARRARALTPGRIRTTRSPRQRSPRAPTTRVQGGPIIQRPKTQLNRLRRLQRRTNRRMNRRQTYEFV